MEKGERWADGRHVAIRGDVPGKRFDPEDARVLKTPAEREAARLALENFQPPKVDADNPPAWAEHL